jgi:hypothetical protein
MAESEDETMSTHRQGHLSGAGKADYGLLITGATLVGIGGVLGLTGLSLAIITVLKAFRRTLRESDVPPTELAKRKLAQALAAAAAGAAAGTDAWRHGRPTQPPALSG